MAAASDESGFNMAAATDVMRPCNGVLRDVVDTHRSELIRSLDAGTLFLTYLAKHRLIEPADILKYEHYKERSKRNSELLDYIVAREHFTENSYSKFLDALKRSDQEQLAAMLTDINQELEILNDYQNVLEDNLQQIHDYLKTESRRTEVRYSTISPEYKRRLPIPTSSTDQDSTAHQGMAEFLFKVHQGTKATIVHFDRCREVIDKLHFDCEVVAKKNADLMSKLRECNTLVKTLLPIHSTQFEDTDDVASVLSMGSIMKSNEAELLLDSIRHSIRFINQEKFSRDLCDKHCTHILNSMLQDIKTRRFLLDKCTETPRGVKKNKYIPEGFLMEKDNSNVETMAYALAEEMQVYVQQESQVTHKHNLSKLHTPLGMMSHRNFDQIEHDLMHLEKEIRRNDHEQDESLLKQITEATKSEREDCIKMVDDIFQAVRNRRLKLQGMASGTRPKKRAAKKRITRSLDTNFSKKLSDVVSEMRLYMALESDQMAKHKDDLLKRRIAHETEMRYKAAEIKELEKRIRECEFEKERLKKLYSHELLQRDTKVVNKVISPERHVLDPDTTVAITVQKKPPTSSISHQKIDHTLKQNPRRLGEVQVSGIRNKKSIQSAKNPPNRIQERSVTRKKNYTQRNSDNSESARPPNRNRPAYAKPRLTAKARHLTKLKATIKEREDNKMKTTLPKLHYTTQHG